MRPQEVQAVEQLLQRRQALERHERAAADFAARVHTLRSWQAERLAHTYADLLDDPRHRPATEFFLRDLYGAHDFSARDRQLADAWRFFRRWLPEVALRALGHALELDVLTRELDHAMAAQSPEGVTTEDAYARAYRAVGRREARERQLALVLDAGGDLQRLVRQRGLGLLLKAARAPARSAGLGELQDFLERGYRAFRGMSSAERLLDTIRVRETALMNRWFAGARP